MGVVGDISSMGLGQEIKNSTMRPGADTLSMDDFLRLIAVQLSNQDMNNPMSESEMMTQMVQMATVQAMTTFTDVATTTYAASLVGKEVTVAEIVDGKLVEKFGTVTAAGLYGGEQVIFVDGKSYKLSSMMAVGKLPPKDPPKPDNGLPGDGEKPPDGGDGGDGDGEPPTV